MNVFTICNHKGGTGKTTTTMHVAAALGLSGYRVLVVDLDPQAFLTRMLGVEEPPPEASALALFDLDARLEEVPMRPMNSFDLLPSTGRLTREQRRLNKPTDVLWLREVVQEALPYDVVLFDTAAAVTVYSLNALAASQHALVPVTPEYQPVLGAEQTFQTIKMVRSRLNPSLAAPLFLFTQVDARKNAHRKYRHYMRGKYNEQVMQSVIRTSASLAHSQRDGSTAFDTAPNSRGARDYANATDELLRRTKAPPPESASSGNAPSQNAPVEKALTGAALTAASDGAARPPASVQPSFRPPAMKSERP